MLHEEALSKSVPIERNRDGVRDLDDHRHEMRHQKDRLKQGCKRSIDALPGTNHASHMDMKAFENTAALLLALRESALPDQAPSRVLTVAYNKLLTEAKRANPHVPRDAWPAAIGDMSLAVGGASSQSRNAVPLSHEDLELRVLRLLAALHHG